MKTARLIIGVRRGLYDSETELYSIPTCFDSEQSAQNALQSIAEELSGLTDVRLAVAHQPMLSLRPETYGRYDEAGEFPRLYEAKKDEFQGYVIQIDVPDTQELKETARKIVYKHSLQVIDEGPAKEKTLIFIS
jgi:hypothetical protein